MLKLISGFYKRAFFRNVATVATGSLLSQGLSVAFSPIITRLYGPEAFGMLGVFTSMSLMLIPVATLTYAIAIVLPAKDDDAICLIKLSLMLALGGAFFAALLLLFFKDFFVNLLQIQAIERFIFLIPIVLLLSASIQIIQQWMIRKKQFKATATINVTNILYINSAKTAAGFFWPTSTTLILLAAFGYLLNTAQLVRVTKKTLFVASTFLQFRRETFLKIKAVAKQYSDFPMFRAPQFFLNSFSSSLPVLLLTGFFGPAAAGFYSLGRRVLAIPGQVLGKSIGDVFYPRIAEAGHRGEDIQSLIIRATLGLAAVGVVPYGLIFIFGPRLFTFVFGSEWVTAGEYARWVALWTFFVFLNKPSVTSIPVLNMQGFLLFFEIMSLILRALSLFLGFFFYRSDLVAIELFCLIGVLLNIFIILYVISKSGKKS